MPTLKHVLSAIDALGVKEFDSTMLAWKLEQQGFELRAIDTAIKSALAGGYILFTHRGMLRKVKPEPPAKKTTPNPDAAP